MFFFLDKQQTGFLAYMSCNQCDVPSSGPLIFDQTKYNNANGYSTESGIFRAPYSGKYLVTVQLQGKGAEAGATVMLDGITYAYTSTEAVGQGKIS